MSKLCPKCGNEKENPARSYCRECQREFDRDDYAKNKKAYIERAAKNGARYKQEMYEWLLKYFRTHPCVDCGETDPVVLDFDHRDGADKDDIVSKMICEKRYKAALKEVKKCDVRCSNCHRRRTAKQQGWYWLKVLGI